ncbi:DUF3397 family protein [Weissella diestrammenae]|uniref:DUF3397 family protein n=1 Tax=Weissella diestrammenae TaxID=1162633 RepID=A0A7G9T655_9LACO|nr:DUF3397 family protein [Weissella diestrammenae]MCM0582420.1 DUF3397 family protein [Weissella diestrammenae]QNN75580.1 DUF3397 family protein [Weissella diestrammenae]
MLSFLDWKAGLGILVIVWGILLFSQRIGLKNLMPTQIKTFDLMIPLIWWEIGAITFQNWQHAFVPYMWLTFILWGMAVVIYQAFVRQNYTLRRFVVLWWRIIGLVSLLILIVCVVAVLLKLR